MAKNNRMKRLIARDGRRCHYCKEEAVLSTGEYQKGSHNTLIATADHIVPKSMGGSGHIKNFVMACRGCNEKRADNMYYCNCGTCKVAINHFFYSTFGTVIGPVKPRVWKHDGEWVVSYGLNSYGWNSWVSAMRAVPSREKVSA